MEFEALRKKWSEAGQGHVFRYWDELEDAQRDVLCKQARSIDIDMVNKVYKKLSQGVLGGMEEAKEVKVEPLPGVVARESISFEKEKEWEEIGLREICSGRVAVLLMAGGQGTRLGCDNPKGMYSVGVPSNRSLFELQAHRLLKVQQLAEQFRSQLVLSGSNDNIAKIDAPIRIPWYIMTSFVTENATREFFASHNSFGLDPTQLYFFNQDLFPCLKAENGRILMAQKGEIAIAPNGNGGLWSALRSSGALEDMKKRGVTLVASYGVDNILAKVADPVFIGFSTAQASPISCKVVAKANPQERVGVLCLRNGSPAVIEYSEIDEVQAHAVDPSTGKLLFNAAHIVLNNFTTDFIQQIVDPKANKLEQLPYHIAKKQIPCIDDDGQPTSIWGWKFELFVFDVFDYASHINALEVIRAQEFSPLKNSIASPSDNPLTCRQHMSKLHQQWALEAGAKFSHSAPNQSQKNSSQLSASHASNGVQKEGESTSTPSISASQEEEPLFEISPEVSYFGEGLKPLIEGKTIHLPFHLTLESLKTL